MIAKPVEMSALRTEFLSNTSEFSGVTVIEGVRGQ